MHSAMDVLTAMERRYVLSLKKRDRATVTRFLEEEVTPRKAHCEGEKSLRMCVLGSSLPAPLRATIFNELGGSACSCAKYVKWVTTAIALPLGRVHVARRAKSLSPREPVGVAAAAMDVVTTGYGAAKLEVLKMVCQTACGGALTSTYALGLEGAPGVGKTHFVCNAMSVALGRPMVSIQLGGATDVSYLLGQMYTYEGSKEGRLAAGLIESGCCNPIFFFDEVDKVSESERGREIVATLIHLIDPVANRAIRDRYLHGIDLDFSQCTFVFGYNDASRVSPVLLDRITRIHIPTPSLDERCDIVTRHILPKVRRRLKSSFTLDDAGVAHVLAQDDVDGMRDAERNVEHLLSLAQLQDVLAEDGTKTGSTLPLQFVREHCLAPKRVVEDRPPCSMYS